MAINNDKLPASIPAATAGEIAAMPKLLHVIEGDRKVRSMLVHRDQLIVVREPTISPVVNQTIQLQVYDAVDDFALKRTLTMPTSTWDSTVSMTACSADVDCVFVGTGETIYRVDCTRSTSGGQSYSGSSSSGSGSGRQIGVWCSVGSKIIAMSSDADKLLVLTGSMAFGSLFGNASVTVKQYSLAGAAPLGEKTVRTSAASGMWHHTVLRPNGDFVVSHSDTAASLHRVSWLDRDGKMLFVYGGKPGSAFGHLCEPRQLTVDTKGNTFVADSANHRVLMLNVGQKIAREIQLDQAVDGGLREPFAIYLDETRGRLYVGESAGDSSVCDRGRSVANTRLLVFDDIFV